MLLRPAIHIILHFAVPAIAAKIFYPARWRYALLIMLLTLAIDLDHLFADPIYDPARCSIGFHMLHTYYAIAGYVLLLFHPLTRLVGLGLVIHIILDGIDCAWMMYL